MIKAVIVEDESLAAKRLESLIIRYNPEIEILTHLSSVKSASAWFMSNPHPDLVFMDIHLEDGLSFSIFENVSLKVPVIFTTAFDEYMIKAFRVNSIDYLLKPINFEELSGSLDKFFSLRSQFSTGAMDIRSLIRELIPREETYKSRFLVNKGNGYVSVNADEIGYFYSEDKVTVMVTSDGRKLIVDYTLDKLGTMLDPKDFYRISRQFLISGKSIRQINRYSGQKLKLTLNPPTEKDVFVSQEKNSGFRDWLDR